MVRIWCAEGPLLPEYGTLEMTGAWELKQAGLCFCVFVSQFLVFLFACTTERRNSGKNSEVSKCVSVAALFDEFFLESC